MADYHAGQYSSVLAALDGLSTRAHYDVNPPPASARQRPRTPAHARTCARRSKSLSSKADLKGFACPPTGVPVRAPDRALQLYPAELHLHLHQAIWEG